VLERLKGKKIGVLMGGLSSEREVSLVTGKAVYEAIKRKGLDAVSIDVDKQIASRLGDIDLAFIALHGTLGEAGTIQGILEYLKIPYTGSGVLGSSLAFDKISSKELFKYHGIPTADYQVFLKKERKQTKRALELPLVVKPSNQGSSIGITIVKNENDWEKALDLAFSYSERVLVERFIEGRLIAIGMKENLPLPIVHIRPKSGFYDYESKYTAGKTEYICPATDLSGEETRRCEETAKRVFEVLRGRGFPRLDAIVDNKGTPYILEMNTIPGMTATSLLPMAARQAGLEFDDLVIEILKTAQLDYEGQETWITQ
jgi:D-alanine-D-alanine ligase